MCNTFQVAYKERIYGYTKNSIIYLMTELPKREEIYRFSYISYEIKQTK